MRGKEAIIRYYSCMMEVMIDIRNNNSCLERGDKGTGMKHAATICRVINNRIGTILLRIMG